MADIKELVSEIVRGEFENAKIESIDVTEDVDSDGDPILRITVVFDPSGDGLDSQKMVGLVRHLRPKLAENNIVSFPLVRFVSKADADKLKRAAA